MKLTVQDVIQWFTKANDKIQANQQYLTSLDQAIGDGDHGINMARGFQEVMNKFAEQDYVDVSAVVKDVAMTIISKVGGAAGPLYGSAFLKFSMAVKGKEEIDLSLLTKGLAAALEGIKQRGKAEEGEKTLVDVWSPLVHYLQTENDVLSDQIIEVARNAMEKTEEMMATKGRAAYFKERSIGHLDPGAVSSYYIFEALGEVIKGGE